MSGIKPGDYNKKRCPSGRIVALGIVPFGLGMTVPFVIGNSTLIVLLTETFILLVLLVYFYFYFRGIGNLNVNPIGFSVVLYSLFLMVMLLGGFFNRTIPSEVVAMVGITILTILGYENTRKLNYKTPSNAL